MIEIPIGKALIAVECGNLHAPCMECFVDGYCSFFPCQCQERKDGKNVIFKIVDINSHYIDGTMINETTDRR